MKKQYLLVLLAAMATGACSPQPNPSLRKTDLKIISPKGAPAVAMYNFVNGLTTINTPATELLPEFSNNNYDVIVAPTKGGLTRITKTQSNYTLAATVTFGNFSLVATGNDSDHTLNAEDKVLYFQPNDIPGMVFDYLYKNLELVTYTVNDDSQLGPALTTGTFKVDETTTINLDYVFAAEPLITNLKKNNNIYQIAKDAFETKTGGKAIYQASVFVNKNTDKTKINNFLTLLEQDVNKAVTNPKEITKTLEMFGDADEQAQKFKFNSTVIYNCMASYNGLGLGFRKASSYKEDINYFVNDILKSGLTITDEAYYE